MLFIARYKTVYKIALFIIIILVLSGVSNADTTDSIDHNGSRHFRIHLPPQYQQGKPLPVVIVIHGGGGNADGVANSTDMNIVADKYGFITVYPSGTGKKEDKFLTWNSGICCGYALENHIDDVGFISAMMPFTII